MARDLHDGISQDLYATQLSLTALLDRVPDHLHEPLEELIDRQTSVIASVRALLRAQPSPKAAVSLDELIDDLERTAHRDIGHSVELHADAIVPDTVPALMAHHAVHALKEMLSNAVRHGSADHVWARVDVNHATLRLQVDDDGRGVPAARRHGFGLANLKARAEACGGSFDITRRFPTGTTARWNASLTWRTDSPRRRRLSLLTGVGSAPTLSA